MSEIKSLLYLNFDLGETGIVPEGAIVNIGGVSGDNFTIGGKGVVLADGTTTGPNGSNVIGLQKVYDNSATGNLYLSGSKGLNILGSSNLGMRIDGGTGAINIDAPLTIDDVTITGLINGSIDIQKFYDDFQKHANNDVTPKHTALQISVANSDMTVLTASNVQDSLSQIDVFLANLKNIKTFVYEEINGATLWVIQHAKDAINPNINIYDAAGSLILPDSVKIIDNNVIHVEFAEPQTGKAVILFA